MTKLVNVTAVQTPIPLKIPVRGNLFKARLTLDEIRTCLFNKACVEEVLEDDSMVLLTLLNYKEDFNATIKNIQRNTSNQLAEAKRIAEKEAAAKAMVEKEAAVKLAREKEIAAAKATEDNRNRQKNNNDKKNPDVVTNPVTATVDKKEDVVIETEPVEVQEPSLTSERY